MTTENGVAAPARAQRYGVVPEAKAGGATYTPAALADFVAAQIVAVHAFGEARPLRVLDPAVGDGALLMSLLRVLGPRVVEVFGFDVDRPALERARARLAAAFPRATLRLSDGDFLRHASSAPADGPSALFRPRPATYDIVIANPPYVRTQIIGAREAQTLAAAFGLTGRVDLSAAFLVAISRVLAPHGTAGVIVSNRFMSTRAGASVRRALRSGFTLRHVWDLGDTKLFEAAVLPAVLIAQGSGITAGQPPSMISVYETTQAHAGPVVPLLDAISRPGVASTPDGRRFAVKHGQLDAGNTPDGVWRLTNADTASWLATVAAHSWKTFGDLGKVRVGVKTCADAVFIRSDWGDMPDDRRPELLRPLTTHHAARRFRALQPRRPRAILYPHASEAGRRTVVDLARYPRARAYLESHRATLSARGYVLDAGRRWYEIWVPQDPAAWDAPKLVFRDIAERPTFWIDAGGTVVNGDCYWLGTVADTDLLWLAAAVANSTFIEAFYDCRFNNKLYAGRRRFITQYVEQFPLPDPATSGGRELVELAKEIAARADDADAVFSLESRLDRLVWRSFGLELG